MAADQNSSILEQINKELNYKIAPTINLISQKILLAYAEEGKYSKNLRISENLNYQSNLSIKCLKNKYPYLLEDKPIICYLLFETNDLVDKKIEILNSCINELVELAGKKSYIVSYYKHIIASHIRNTEIKYNVNLEEHVPSTKDDTNTYFGISYLLDKNNITATLNITMGIFNFSLIVVNTLNVSDASRYRLIGYNKSPWLNTLSVYNNIPDVESANIRNSIFKSCPPESYDKNPLLYISWKGDVRDEMFLRQKNNYQLVEPLIRIDFDLLVKNKDTKLILYQTGCDYNVINNAIINSKFLNDNTILNNTSTFDGKYKLSDLVKKMESIYEYKRNEILQYNDKLPEEIKLYRVSIASNFGLSCIPDINVGSIIELPHFLSTTYMSVSSNLSNFTNYHDKNIVFELTVKKPNYYLLFFPDDYGVYEDESEAIVDHRAILRVTNISIVNISTEIGIKEKVCIHAEITERSNADTLKIPFTFRNSLTPLKTNPNKNPNLTIVKEDAKFKEKKYYLCPNDDRVYKDLDPLKLSNYNPKSYMLSDGYYNDDEYEDDYSDELSEDNEYDDYDSKETKNDISKTVVVKGGQKVLTIRKIKKLRDIGYEKFMEKYLEKYLQNTQPPINKIPTSTINKIAYEQYNSINPTIVTQKTYIGSLVDWFTGTKGRSINIGYITNNVPAAAGGDGSSILNLILLFATVIILMILVIVLYNKNCSTQYNYTHDPFTLYPRY